jgi:uncharacterized protein YuzE
MSALIMLCPELVAEVSAALTAEGRDDLASQIKAAVIERWTYDPFADAGNIYFARPDPSWHHQQLSHPVAETISFHPDQGINVDVDHDGHLFGIEYLGRPDVLAKLRQLKPA